MSRKLAAILLLAICVLLSVLLLLDAISPLAGGVGFAIALVVLGLASGGFRR